MKAADQGANATERIVCNSQYLKGGTGNTTQRHTGKYRVSLEEGGLKRKQSKTLTKIFRAGMGEAR